MLYPFLYSLIFIMLFCIDRISKAWAVQHLSAAPYVINDYFSYTLAWNRGISWSMLHSDNHLLFWLLTSVIGVVIVTFGIYTLVQYRSGSFIFFESMVLAGAISNFVDRCWYGAVVDFIELHYRNWYWPAFNIADACIVSGVIGIMIKTIYESHVNKN